MAVRFESKNISHHIKSHFHTQFCSHMCVRSSVSAVKMKHFVNYMQFTNHSSVRHSTNWCIGYCCCCCFMVAFVFWHSLVCATKCRHFGNQQWRWSPSFCFCETRLLLFFVAETILFKQWLMRWVQVHWKVCIFTFVHFIFPPQFITEWSIHFWVIFFPLITFSLIRYLLLRFFAFQKIRPIFNGFMLQWSEPRNWDQVFCSQFGPQPTQSLCIMAFLWCCFYHLFRMSSIYKQTVNMVAGYKFILGNYLKRANQRFQGY